MAGEERISRAQNLILENRKRLSVSGVEEVVLFDENAVRMNTVLGVLTVHGSGLHVENLSVDTGEMLLTGEISDLIYEESAVRSSWIKRLFG